MHIFTAKCNDIAFGGENMAYAPCFILEILLLYSKEMHIVKH